jgi:hypothetical protein
MTVSSTTSKVSFSGNGSTTAFAVSFYFLANSDLKVTLRKADGTEVVKTLATDYTVTGAGVTSGGTVTMGTAPASGETLVIQRNVPFTQLVDYQPNDPFPANTHEQALDKLTMEVQQLNEAVSRSIKVSTTNTITSPEFTVDAATRANKVLSFDGSGELAVTQELGTYKGNWATGTTYAVRSIIKDTSNNNIYICVTAHTASGAQPISTNTDSAKWALLVDAASATSSASAASSSASAASTSASNAATSASNASSSASSASTSASTATTQASNASTSASNASTSATNAANSATAAANSATTAAAAAAAGLYRQVLDKTANYTVLAADQGTLFRMNTGSGALTVTLPQISTVTDGFKVSVVKWTGDANGVTINRAGSDTINGATSSTIGSQYSQTTFVADFETNTWLAVQSGLGSTNVTVDVFSGNGSTTAFTLSGDPGTKNNTFVHISGVYQNKSTYSQSGTTITFSAAPPSGTSNIEIVWTQPLSVGVPGDGTVTTAKLADASVTTAKIVDASVTTAKHADASITPVKLSSDAQYYGFKNRIINGAMVIDQRNAGASVTPTDNTYTIDRWQYSLSQTSKLTAQQSSTAATGFINSLLTTSSSAYSVGASDYFMINQRIEGLNTFDLSWGTASAKTVTLSFWVRSSLTGTFGGAINNASNDRSYPFTYTINSANTFEQKSITIAGDTGGTWLTTNGVGMTIRFGLGVGSTYSGTAGAWAAAGYFSATGATSVVSTNGATWYVTGVQLEKGSTATSFDYRPYGTELQLCQRYGELIYSFVGLGANTTTVASSIQFKVSKRSAPSATVNGVLSVNDSNGAITQSSSSIGTQYMTTEGGVLNMGNFSGVTQFKPYNSANTTNRVFLDSEL